MLKMMMLFLLSGFFLLSGCASTMYTWKGYDNKLYSHYKNPAEYAEYVENLKEIIEAGDQSGTVPPGLYAEYGYTFYVQGYFTQSITYFQKEYDKWPESRVLMAKMIDNAKKESKKAGKGAM